MPRFYCALPLQTGSSLALPENVVRHLQVLRLMPGDPIRLFNGQGSEFLATVSALGKRNGVAEIGEELSGAGELPYRLMLAQSLPEASKMDWIIEKAVELGASAIQPLAAQRSVVKLSADCAARKLQHWHGIVVAASEQSGRARLAELHDVAELPRWAASPPPGKRLMLTPRAERSLAGWVAASAPQDIVVVVGPEGGFSEQEEDLLISQDALPLSMGPRILRTETAGLAALAIINAAWGQM